MQFTFKTSMEVSHFGFPFILKISSSELNEWVEDFKILDWCKNEFKDSFKFEWLNDGTSLKLNFSGRGLRNIFIKKWLK